MLQLSNSLFWVSRDILMGEDEFALTNDSPPIRISRDTQNKLFNKAFSLSLSLSLSLFVLVYAWKLNW